MINRSWHLDHHADLGHTDRCALLGHLPVTLINKPFGRINLSNTTDHRQHDSESGFQPLARAHHRADLSNKDLRMIERHSQTPPTQEWVVLFDWKVRERFVTTNIECSHGDRTRRERFQMSPINDSLLFFGREGVARHKVNFGAVKADALRASVD